MPPVSILIVGCRVAGPTLASFLLLSPLPASQKPNITILERSPKVNNHGQNVDIRDKGLPIIRKLGLENLIRASHTGEEGVIHVDESNRTWASIAADKSGKLRTPTSDIEILRGRLAEICWSRSRWISDRVKAEGGAGVEYIFGDDLVELDQQGEKVQVHFKKSPSRSFDIVVGADGLQSRTRKLVWGSSKEEDKVVRLGMYAGFFSIPREDGDSNWRRWFHTSGRRGIMLRPDGQGTKTTVFMHVDNEKDKRLIEVAEKGHLGVEEQKTLLEEYFSDAGWQSERVIREMWKAQDFYYDLIGQIKMANWSKGRVVLLGDAGYCASPLSGMGTTLAFTGAYTLAGALLNFPDDPAKAFASYQEKMQPLVERAQKLAPGLPHLLTPETAWGVQVMFYLLKILSMSKILHLLFLLMGPKESDLSVEDYGFEQVLEFTDEEESLTLKVPNKP